MDEKKEFVLLNEKKVTKEELEKEKERVVNKKGITIVEIAPGKYKTRIQE